MRLTLEIQTGPARGGKAVAQNGQRLRVGRAKEADLAVAADPLVSPEHFTLNWTGNGWVLTDMNSRLGTFVNGQRLTQAMMNDGDTILAGQTQFRVRIEPGVAVPPPPEDASKRTPLFRPELVSRVTALLHEQSDPVFALLDAARDPHVLGLLIVEENAYRSLYEGPAADDYADFAPYLVELPKDTPLLEVLIREGWNNSWGVFLTSRQPFAEVRKHFRRFLLAELPNGDEVLFRFYDPRVLRVYLRNCNVEETAAFFGPVTSFLIEGEEPGTLLRFTATAKGIHQEVISFGPCVDVPPDLPWVKAVLDHCNDLHPDERLDLLRGWREALPTIG